MGVASLAVILSLSAEAYTKGLEAAEAKAKSVGGNIVGHLSAIGGAAVTGGMALAGAGIAAVSTAAVMGVSKIMSWAETLDGVGDVLGTNAQQSAALAVAIKGVGGDVGTMTSQMTILTRGLLDAKGQIGPTGTILEKMGIQFQDASGKILPATDILSSVADVIGNMPDGLEKTSLMTDLFGKSGKDLSDVMTALANGGLAAAGEKAQAMGLSMSDTAVNGAIQLGRSGNDLKMGLDGLLMQLSSGLIPVLSELAGWLKTAMADPAVQAGIANIAAGVSEFAAKVVTAIPIVITWFTQAFDYLKNNQGIIVGILAAVGVAVGVFVYTTVIPAAIAAITALAPIILIMAAIGVAVYLLYQAWTTNFGGIRDIVASVTAWIQSTISSFLAAVQGFWDAHGAAIMATAKAMWDGVMAVVNWFVGQFTLIFQAFQDAFSGNWTGFGEKLRQAWDNAWQMIKNVASGIWDWFKVQIPILIQNIIGFFTNTDWGAIGLNIIKGIAAGILGALEWLKNAAIAAAKAAFDAAKGFLGIESPSTVFMGVGANMMQGWAKGIKANDTLPEAATMNAADKASNSVDNRVYNFNYAGNAAPQQIYQQYEMAKLVG